MVSLTLIAVLADASVGDAQPEAPGLAYTGPGEGETIVAIREALLDFARRRGLGLRDLADVTATSNSNTAAPELAAAVEDYVAFRYAEAVKKLDALALRLAESGALGFSRREIADVFIYRAMSKTELGAANEARDDLIRAATIFPTYRLDEARFRPSLRAAFERARTSVSNGAGSKVEMGFEAGCVVHLDGERVAVGDTVSLRSGLHYVRARCAGFEPLVTATVFAAGESRFAPTLAALPDSRVSALEASRGATRLIWVHASRAVSGRVEIELIDTTTRKTLRQWSIVVDSPKSVSTLLDVLTSLLDTEFAAPAPPPVIVTKSQPTRWYQKRWVWVVVGAAAASAIIVPFALRDGSPTGFGASLEPVP